MEKYEPHAYQRYCIERGIIDNALALWLDPGLGKTSITETILNDLKYNRFLMGKTLVVAPKKVAQSTWGKEQQKWEHLKNLRVIKVLGSEKQRIRALNTPGDLYVTNRDNVHWIVDYYRNAWPFDTLVLDEATSFKNYSAKRFKALTWIKPWERRVIELTGTPAPKGLLDLWAQIYLLDGGKRLGKTFGGYRSRYFERGYDGFSYMPKPGAEEEIYRLIADLVVVLKSKDYLELPGVWPDDIPVALDPKSEKIYREMERKMLLEVDPETVITAPGAAALSNKLQQLCNGAIYDENHGAHEIHQCKIEAFMELVESLNGKPAIVYYSFRHDVPRLKKALKGMNLSIRELKTPTDEDDWNAGKIDILLTHPASSAYGLNLQDGGNHVIWFGLTWDLELYTQAIDRLNRQGQTQKVIVHNLVTEGGRDEDILEALRSKGDAQERLKQSLKVRIEKARNAA